MAWDRLKGSGAEAQLAGRVQAQAPAAALATGSTGGGGTRARRWRPLGETRPRGGKWGRAMGAGSLISLTLARPLPSRPRLPPTLSPLRLPERPAQPTRDHRPQRKTFLCGAPPLSRGLRTPPRGHASPEALPGGPGVSLRAPWPWHSLPGNAGLLPSSAPPRPCLRESPGGSSSAPPLLPPPPPPPTTTRLRAWTATPDWLLSAHSPLRICTQDSSAGLQSAKA